jgi:cytochrome b
MVKLMVTVRIWDLPTRLFHWALAVCFVGMVVTGKMGGEAMVWHFRLGYGVFSLLLFRLIWGWLGGHWSRFAQWPLRPSRVLAYVRGQAPKEDLTGHSPLGSWSVVVVLFFLALQVGTGLVSDDEISNTGPWAVWVPGSVVSWATGWHKNWGQWIVMALVALHLLALLVHFWKKTPPLLPAMWHGDKVLAEAAPASNDQGQHRLLALAVFIVAAGVVFYLVTRGG